MAEDLVILVDEQDRELGAMEKLAAHERGGTRHRAFSVFIVDPQGRWLLQRRAAGKYHFPGLWTNACCSHPRPGEATADRTDPYGETGFSSIRWFYGTLVYRPERIAVAKTVAPM